MTDALILVRRVVRMIVEGIVIMDVKILVKVHAREVANSN